MRIRLVHLVFVTLLLALWAEGIHAESSVRLVKDIRTGTTDAELSSDVEEFVPFQNKVLFRSARSNRLLITDGTTNGTQALATDWGENYYLGELNAEAYFLGKPSGLRKTDGTPEGTQEVAQIQGFGVREIQWEAHGNVFNNHLYFAAKNSNGGGGGLWKTDGTGEGTELLVEFDHPASMNFEIISNSERLFFYSATSEAGIEPWVSDGTEEGTHQLDDLNPGQNHSLISEEAMIVYNDHFYFLAKDSASTMKLWKSDGTTTGTTSIADFSYTDSYSHLSELIIFNELIYAAVPKADGALELWKSNGEAQGTSRVYEGTFLYSRTSEIPGMCVWSDSLYFTDDDQSKLLKLSAGSSTPQELATFQSSEGVRHRSFLPLEDHLLFFSKQNDGEIWKTNGTPEGTEKIGNVFPSFQPIDSVMPPVASGIAVFAGSTDDHGREPWVSDGTPDGTHLLKNLSEKPASSNVTHMIAHEGKLIFGADDGVHGRELWISDGTNSGTYMLKDIIEGERSSDVRYFEHFNGEVVFIAAQVYEEEIGERIVTSVRDELWKTDGTKDGTQQVATFYDGERSIVDADTLEVFGDLIFIDFAKDYAPFVSDGTKEGTYELYHPNDSPPEKWLGPVAFDDQVVFSGAQGVRSDVVISDGTPEGTRLLLEPDRAQGNLPHSFTTFDNDLYFVANNGEEGDESLWRSDGHTTNTVVITDDSYPFDNVFAASLAGDRLLVETDDGQNPIWYLERESETLQPLENLGLQPVDQDPSVSHPIGGSGMLIFPRRNDEVQSDRLPFLAYDPTVGTELYMTDGTTGGTQLLADINPGPSSIWSWTITPLAPNRFLFEVDTPEHGNEYYYSNGTASGTRLIADIDEGVGDGVMSHDLSLNWLRWQPAAIVGETLFIGAYNEDVGAELFAVPMEEIDPAFNTAAGWMLR